MQRRRLLAMQLLAAPLLATPLLSLARPARAQAFPSRPLRILVGFAAGGASDTQARLVAAAMEKSLGQPVVVENRPGAGGNIAVDAVAKSPADGYTFGAASVSNLAINPHLYRSMPYDPLKDLAPLSLMAINPNILVARPGFPASDLAGLIAHAKANPGKLSYGSPGSGTSQHMAAEMLKITAGIDMAHVPYRGGAAAYPDLLSGRIDLLVDVFGTAWPQVQSGRIGAIAVLTPERLPLAPMVPTAAETLPGFVAVSWLGFVAPMGMPPAVLAQLAGAVQAAIRTPEVRARITESGSVPVGSSAEEFAKFIREEHARWLPAVRASGASVD
ncbi:MAG: tripartite tricarboxylate transporter substrate binding protein [Acetobacteraceae bacterium]|nr:tripartite tricarboxylate transporter substrate binding protein [Acetobacteraceae bacterium]